MEIHPVFHPFLNQSLRLVPSHMNESAFFAKSTAFNRSAIAVDEIEFTSDRRQSLAIGPRPAKSSMT